MPRPAGIFWELLSERRLKIVPVLQVLKESQEQAGKVIVMKEEDTDIEQNQNARSRRRGQIRRRFGRRNQRRAISQTDTEQQGVSTNQPPTLYMKYFNFYILILFFAIARPTKA